MVDAEVVNMSFASPNKYIFTWWVPWNFPSQYCGNCDDWTYKDSLSNPVVSAFNIETVLVSDHINLNDFCINFMNLGTCGIKCSCKH